MSTARKKCKNHKKERVNYVLLTSEWIIEKIKEEIRKYLETKTHHKIMKLAKSSIKRKIYSVNSLYSKRKKIL